jgi:hypothetical protein
VLRYNINTHNEERIPVASGKRQFLEDARQLGWARDTREFESDEEVSWGISRED